MSNQTTFVPTPWMNETTAAPTAALCNNGIEAFLIALLTNASAGIFFVLLFCHLRTRIPEYYSRGEVVTGFISQVLALCDYPDRLLN